MEQYELTPEGIEKALMLIEGEIDYGRRMNYKNDTISLMVFEKVKTLGYRLPEQTNREVVKELLIKELKDDGEYYWSGELAFPSLQTLARYLIDLSFSLLKPELLSDEEIINIIFRPGERGAIEEARQVAQAQLDKWCKEGE